MKNIFCILGLHKWVRRGSALFPYTERVCEREDCRKEQYYGFLSRSWKDK